MLQNEGLEIAIFRLCIPLGYTAGYNLKEIIQSLVQCSLGYVIIQVFRLEQIISYTGS